MTTTKTPARKSPRKKADRAVSPSQPSAPMDAARLHRVVVEGVHPDVYSGRFPTRRVLGETIVLSSDVHAEGHDSLAAAVMYRKQGAAEWTDGIMHMLVNFGCNAQFSVSELARYYYT